MLRQESAGVFSMSLQERYEDLLRVACEAHKRILETLKTANNIPKPDIQDLRDQIKNVGDIQGDMTLIVKYSTLHEVAEAICEAIEALLNLTDNNLIAQISGIQVAVNQSMQSFEDFCNTHKEDVEGIELGGNVDAGGASTSSGDTAVDLGGDDGAREMLDEVLGQH